MRRALEQRPGETEAEHVARATAVIDARASMRQAHYLGLSPEVLEQFKGSRRNPLTVLLPFLANPFRVVHRNPDPRPTNPQPKGLR